MGVRMLLDLDTFIRLNMELLSFEPCGCQSHAREHSDRIGLMSIDKTLGGDLVDVTVTLRIKMDRSQVLYDFLLFMM